MAKTISEDELQLRKRARRRLIGAIALVTIVAVFLPMVLDHDPKPVRQDISIQIPSPTSGIFNSKIVPAAPGMPAANSAAKGEPAALAKFEAPFAGESAKTAAAPAAEPAPNSPPVYDTEAAPPRNESTEVRKPQAKPAPKPAAKNAPPPKMAEKAKAADTVKVAAPGAGSFVVQVAALNDAEKAKQMREQIAAEGITAYTEVVPTAKGNVTRVRAGPFASREVAEKTRDKLKGMGLNGNIVPK